MKNFDLPIKAEVIPYTNKGGDFRFLLLKRCPEDGSFWQPVTGTLESDESLVSCMSREMQEEAGISENDIFQITDLLHVFHWMKKGVYITEYVFGAELTNEIDVKLSDEHTDYKWCSYEEALASLGKAENVECYKIFMQKMMGLR